MDEWKEVWDWARQVWGENKDYSFERFFRNLAQQRAKAEGWEELGSSDVWHACFYAAKLAKGTGTITTRHQLEDSVSNNMGV